VACPGAVSLSVSKAVLTFSKSIVVDVSETPGLPDKIKTAYRTGGASVPIVILCDPGLTQTFGRFDHPGMESQKYDAIFKEAREKIQKSLKDGTFSKGGKAPVVVKVEGTKIESWKSAAGTAIEAKLIGIEDDSVYLFQTKDGKSIRATAAQLDKASVAKARKLAKIKP